MNELVFSAGDRIARLPIAGQLLRLGCRCYNLYYADGGIGIAREWAYGAWTYASAKFFLTQYRRLYPLYLMTLVVAQAVAYRNFASVHSAPVRPYIKSLPIRWR